jgi:hypothetical protein
MHPTIRLHIELFWAESKRTVHIDMKEVPDMWTPEQTIRWMLERAGEKFPAAKPHSKPRD